MRVLPSGEASKSREAKAALEDYLLSQSCTRDTCLIALGGGVIGDLVGYTASTFMRGVPFVQIPTTLLAMVDSSIGGKTAIDTPHGKNLVGSFWQPRLIFMDLAVLRTLPARELANGMAEVIKTAAISSLFEFERLEKGKDKIQSVILGEKQATEEEQQFVASVISASARFKAKVVTEDERESGLRGLLNFGHSLGHALEAVLTPEWLHGECVSIGLIWEAEVSCVEGYCSEAVVDRLRQCLALYGLPTSLDAKTVGRLDLDRVMTHLKVDKKNKGAQKRIVLLSEIGKTVEAKATDVPDAPILQIVQKYLPSAPIASGPGQTACSSRISNLVLAFDRGLACPPALREWLEQRYTLESDGPDSLQGQLRDAAGYKGTAYVHLTYQAGSSDSKDEYSSSYEYVLLENEPKTDALLTFMDTVTGTHRHVGTTQPTSFVTPTISDYARVLPAVLEQWLEGADAIEFRVDYLLTQGTQKEWIACTGVQLAHLRRKTSLPVIFTVRTVPQAGRFDPKRTQLYTDLVGWAHRWGCDYVDLELTTLSDNKREDLMMLNYHYPSVKMIASFHDPERTLAWPQMKPIYDQAYQLFEKYNHPGVIKLVGFALHALDNAQLEQFRHQLDPARQKELILINMGPKGKLSRVANRFLTPATHPALPTVAAPGQLSIQEIHWVRKLLEID
ncbi:3-dehydroquinate synthase-domain-containing protein [Sporodiniella umbellata]|nr:3-dehydroquinate synthase-domain-containing protein [Sporodiniella umbellata]